MGICDGGVLLRSSAVGPLSAATIAAALLVAGCGAPTDDVVGQPAGVTTGQAAINEGVFGGNVAAVLARGSKTFDVTLEPFNVDRTCNTEPTATITEDLPVAVYVTTTYRVAAPACPSSRLTTTLQLDTELAGRMLVIDQRAWVLEPAGTVTGPLRQCDETLGCDPQPAACNDDSYRLALDAGDFPRNGRTWTAQACEPPWLIMDVDTTASGCSATSDDPASNPCLAGPRRVTRWVFTARGPLWDTVATLPLSGGCGPKPPPSFPRVLCATLPAV